MTVVRIFLLAAALALGGCGDPPVKLPLLSQSDVILAFGDSLTYGTGAAEHESYPTVLAQLTGRTVIGAGVPGEVTARGLARLPQVLDAHRPRLVIVCLGGNDLLRKVPLADIKSNLRRIIQTIRDRGAAVVLVGVPQPALLSSAPQLYEELAREFGIPYDGKTVKSVLYSADMKSDAIHPNAKGYRVIAEALAKLLKDAGAL
jgi:acyl-CoA thioesterase I